MATASKSPARKSRYHHGDLATALVAAGLELAQEGGPDALTLREAARRAGVSPTAAYRHFADREDLLRAVTLVVVAHLGSALRVATQARLPRGLSPADRSCQRLIAIGRAYVRFAVANPGEYRMLSSQTGFPDRSICAPDGATEFDDPYCVLGEILDEMAASGAIRSGRRDGAETPMWALVHGLSALILDGPYAQLTQRERDAMVDRSLDLAVNGMRD